MVEPMILALSCADRPGIVARVTGYLAQMGCNIIEAQQFNDIACYLVQRYGPELAGIEPLRHGVGLDEPAALRSVIISDDENESGPLQAALEAAADPTRKYAATVLPPGSPATITLVTCRASRSTPLASPIISPRRSA